MPSVVQDFDNEPSNTAHVHINVLTGGQPVTIYSFDHICKTDFSVPFSSKISLKTKQKSLGLQILSTGCIVTMF